MPSQNEHSSLIQHHFPDSAMAGRRRVLGKPAEPPPPVAAESSEDYSPARLENSAIPGEAKDLAELSSHSAKSVSAVSKANDPTVVGSSNPPASALQVAPFPVKAMDHLSVESHENSSISDAASSNSSISSETTLVCPICNDSMLTLLQLNRHLDDVHGEGAAVNRSKQDSVPTSGAGGRLKGKLLKSKSALAASLPRGSPLGSSTDINADKSKGPASRTASPQPDTVTRDHWQRLPAGTQVQCAAVGCSRQVGGRGGAIHCRCCGRIFCQQHAVFRMKLNPATAKHSPESGVWAVVCQSCFESRIGYGDNGTFINCMDEFRSMRQKQVDERSLEVNRLEKRLMSLLEQLSQSELRETGGVFSYAKAALRREIERTVTTWQADSDAVACPICKRKFTYALRRHHCRLCGQVVCADHETGCSRDVMVSLLMAKLGIEKQNPPQVSIRICRTCKSTVFGRRNFQEEVNAPLPPLFVRYAALNRAKRSILTALVRFEDMVAELNNTAKPSKERLAEAAKQRKTLMNLFAQFDLSAKKLMAVELNTNVELHIQKSMYAVAANFLQEHMFTLKALPRILKKQQDEANGTASPGLSEEEIQSLREQLIVMQEQLFMMGNMIEEAKAKRRFDEVAPLELSTQEITAEISKIREKLGEFTI